MPRINPLALVAGVLAFIGTAYASTLVGNPSLRLVLLDGAQPGYPSSALEVEAVVYDDCQGGQLVVTVQPRGDVAMGWTHELEAGTWCGITYEFASPVTVDPDS